MKELEVLLENFWVIKAEDKELYYRVKDAIPSIKPFIEEKLGYRIVINPYIIKLEKIPGKSEIWMGIEDFEDIQEYILFMILLMFLENKDREEQFVLSELTDFMMGNYPENKQLDWTLYKHRKSLIKVLKFAQSIYLVKVDDGNEEDFANSVQTEVLYENTGLSKYFMRNFTGNVLNYNSIEDFENDEWLEVDKERGIIRRNRVYRRLVLSPYLFSDDNQDSDFAYIKNQRLMLENDIEKNFEAKFHVHKTSAFLILPEDTKIKDTFPNKKSISDIVLHFNSTVLEMIEEEKLAVLANDTIKVSVEKFKEILARCKQENSEGWGKDFRENMSEAKLYEEVLSYMKGFGFIRLEDEGITIMPSCGKVAGKYPKSFLEKESLDG